MTIPDFLLMNASANQNDRKRLLLDMQLWCLWREVYGSKPFDYKRAVALQKQLATEQAVRLAKKAKEVTKNEKQDITGLLAACLSVAENVLVVEVNCDANMVAVGKPVDFNSHVKDTLVKDRLLARDYGTIRSILLENGFDWIDCGDPRKDLRGFIASLKRYDDKLIPIVFERERMQDKRERFCKFTIKLTWRPVSDSELKTKFHGFLKKRVTQVVG